MKTWLQASAASTALLLAGCVSYPTTPDYGGYPGGYPNDTYSHRYPGDYRPPAGSTGGYGQTVRCESTDGHTRHCDMDTRGGVFLSRRLSDASCTQGRNWGYDSRGVWVTGGCRGEFTTGAGGYSGGYGSGSGYGQGYGGGRVVRCESQDGHSRHCSAPVQRGVQLLRTLSDSACIEGRTWGWDRNGVWVDRGCRAEFSVY